MFRLTTLYLNELLFRNILQPRLRKLELTPWLSIITQSVIYAVSFAFYKEPLGILVCALFLGIANGWLVYKFRLLWAAFALSEVWHILLVYGSFPEISAIQFGICVCYSMSIVLHKVPFQLNIVGTSAKIYLIG